MPAQASNAIKKRYFTVYKLKTSVNLPRPKLYSMPLNKKKGAQNDFFSNVYDVVRLIPKGRVTSYGAIANYLGLKSSARMVGWAMHACPKGVPAHRVVNSAGMLSGK